MQKTIIFFLLITFLNAVFYPTISFALTSGPTAPEYTSFEPIDTKEMVDLATGDFTYNIPLLEVPGPEGGYPLALSYHAGINPEEEASWVGLGWSLNAGAINRFVSGYPDDVKNATDVVTDYWSGGETNTYTAGVGICGFNVGIDVANDTYRGSTVGGYVGIAMDGVTVSARMQPYGGINFSLGGAAGQISGGSDGVSVSYGPATVGLNSGGGYAGLSAAAAGLSGNVGISSQGFSYSLGYSVAGANLSYNSAGYIQGSFGGNNIGVGSTTNSMNSNPSTILSSSTSFNFTIPIYMVTISLGSSYTRYFSFSSQGTAVYGALHANSLPIDPITISPTTASRPTYDCVAFKNPSTNKAWESDVDKELGGGSMPAYDVFQVLGQGIGGVIQPQVYEYGSMYRRKSAEEGVAFINDANSAFKNKVGFRFSNDFSNSFMRDIENTGSTTNDFLDIPSSIGKNEVSYDQTAMDFNKANGMLAGSKHVEWFTNADIINGTARQKGLVYDETKRENNFSTLGYTLNIDNHIGAIMIVNTNGVTYHYTLPVYNFEDQTQYFGPNNFQRSINRSMPYAYTWLLTAITGADYIDRGINGVVDEEDWGYWVKFDYGKWTDQYIWRNPISGTEKDLDGQMTHYSSGKKQLYYLDAIKTRTHTALFVKNIKSDGKGVASVGSGGFETIRDGSGALQEVPASTLKLSQILLFTNTTLTKVLAESFSTEDVLNYSDLRSNGSQLQHAYVNNNFKNIILHQGNSVIDESDLTTNLRTGKNIVNYAVKNIEFNHTNDLCKNTPNSYPMNFGTFSKPSGGYSSGKLTLNSINVKGLNGKSTIPPTSFIYHKASEPYKDKAIDIWGTYKSDYVNQDSKLYDQLTTSQSATKIDAWSLSQIKTSIGSDINVNYESDRFETAVLTPFKNYTILSAQPMSYNWSDSRVAIELGKTEALANIPELAVGKNISFMGWINFINFSGTKANQLRLSNLNLKILGHSINGNQKEVVIVENTELYTQMIIDRKINNDPDPIYGFISGNLFVQRDESRETLGGGLRVKSIGLLSDGIESITEYAYENGATSFEPLKITNGTFYDYSKSIGIDPDNIPDMLPYKNQLFARFLPVLSNNQFLPPPNVVYGKVTIKDKVVDKITNTSVSGLGRSVYEFQTFNNSMLPRTSSVSKTIDGGNTKLNIVRFKDVRNQVGILKQVVNYDVTNKPLKKMQNVYLHDIAGSTLDQQLKDRFNNQGRIDQVFKERRIVNGESQFQITEIEQYPVILIEQTVIDYSIGIQNRSRNINYDFYSGQPTATWVDDSYGNQFISEVMPAYHEYSNLGYKIFASSNKNMLSPVAYTISHKVVPNITTPTLRSHYSNVGLVAASATVWANDIGVFDGISLNNLSQPSIWRVKENYVWTEDDYDNIPLNVDGTSSTNAFTPFNFANLSSNDPLHWEKQNEIVLYSPYSNVLQSLDINGNSSAILMNPSQTLISASCNFTSTNKMAYAGLEFAESYNANTVIKEGNVSLGQGTIVGEFAHTGSQSLKVNSGSEGFKFVFEPDLNRVYKASVWVYLPGFSESEAASNVKLALRVNGNIIKTAQREVLKKAKSHYLINLEFNPNDIPTNLYTGDLIVDVICVNQEASRVVYFDDFRVHPIESNFNSFVYDVDRLLLTYILNEENLYTRFEYDDTGRLIKKYKELLGRPVEKLESENVLNYGNQ